MAIIAQTLNEQAQSKITQLQILISEAEGLGLDATKEKMTKHTAELFLDWADWDEANISTNKLYYDAHPYYSDNSQQMAERLPDFERESVIEILNDAIYELSLVVDGIFTRRSVPTIDWMAIINEGDRLTYNGKPVFLADYTWKHDVTELTEYYGQLDGFYLTPNYSTNDGGAVNSTITNTLNTKPSGNLGTIFISNNQVPDWAISKYPDIQTGGRLYGKFDIDHAGSREMFEHLLAGYSPLIAGNKYAELGYMLFNEPSFHTKANYWNNTDDDGVCVSDSTIKKFKRWLETKHGTISNLNSVWGTSFSTFNDVSVTLPMEVSLQGGPIWYDWMTFNNYRVSEWFKFIKAEIRKHDPLAKVHIKLMPHLFAQNNKDHGVEFESLTELSDISGCDAGAQYLAAWGEEPWKDKYALNWRDAIMTFDFFKSVKPNQIIYDSENHYIMNTAFMEYDLNQDYVRSIFWLSFMHGFTATRIWVWGRDADGSVLVRNEGAYNGGYIISPSQQPKTLNTITATFMDANSFSEELVDMQNLPKPIRVFYSQTSSINNSTYMDEIFDTYSSVFFEGVGVGFATENILSGTVDWEVVLVRATETVTDSEFDALQAYLDAGGTVLIDSESLTKDEYGATRASSLQASSGTIIQTVSVNDMQQKTMGQITARGLFPPVEVTETNAVNSDGCTWKCIENSDGNYVLSIVNLGKSNASVEVSLKNATIGTKCVNLFTGTEVYSSFTLKPYGIYFVEVIDAKPSNIEEDKKEVLNPVLYPNPTKGILNMNLHSTYQNVTLSFFNTQGQIVKTNQYSNIARLATDITGFESGVYIAKLETDTNSSFYKIFKQ